MKYNILVTALIVVLMIAINVVPQVTIAVIMEKGTEHFGEGFSDGQILLHLFAFALTFAFTVDGIVALIKMWRK